MKARLLISGSLDSVSGSLFYDRILVNHLRDTGDVVDVVSLPSRHYVRGLLDSFVDGHPPWAVGDFDILLQDTLVHPLLVQVNRRLKKRVKKPIVGIVHHLLSSENRPSWQNAVVRRIERLYLHTVDGCIFDSLSTRREAEQLAGCSLPSVVAPAGAARVRSSCTIGAIRDRVMKGRLEVLFIGDVVPRRGLHVLISALGMMRESDCHLTVVGSLAAHPSYARLVLRQIEREGLQARVTVLGPLSDAELVEAFARSHLLVVPSSFEGFGMVYLKAMSCGLPAIATTTGSSREIITHGEDGFLVAPEAPDQLCHHLSRLDRDRHRLLAMSLKAVDRHRVCPDLHATMDGASAFLRQVTTRRVAA